MISLCHVYSSWKPAHSLLTHPIPQSILPCYCLLDPVSLLVLQTYIIRNLATRLVQMGLFFGEQYSEEAAGDEGAEKTKGAEKEGVGIYNYISFAVHSFSTLFFL